MLFIISCNLHNQSPIDYDIDLLRFYIRDKKQGKRTAIQETELTPLYIAGNTSLVKANNHNIIIVSLEEIHHSRCQIPGYSNNGKEWRKAFTDEGEQ